MEIQKILDSAQANMERVQHQTISGPAGTRVLYSLVAVLARQFLTEDQQRQVEAILDMHDACLARNGETKSQGRGLVTRAPQRTETIVLKPLATLLYVHFSKSGKSPFTLRSVLYGVSSAGVDCWC